MSSSVPPMFADDPSSATYPSSHEAPRVDVAHAAEPPEPDDRRTGDR